MEWIKYSFHCWKGQQQKKNHIRKRVHRIIKPVDIAGEIPRDVIVRFQNYKDKEQIWESLKAKQPAKHEETVLQVFPDLAAETLARRILKPLLEHMKSHRIQYSWASQPV